MIYYSTKYETQYKYSNISNLNIAFFKWIFWITIFWSISWTNVTWPVNKHTISKSTTLTFPFSQHIIFIVKYIVIQTQVIIIQRWSNKSIQLVTNLCHHKTWIWYMIEETNKHNTKPLLWYLPQSIEFM